VEPGLVISWRRRLARLGTDERGLEVVRQAASRPPRRWLRGLRSVIEVGAPRSRRASGIILDLVGEKSDVRRLRALSRELKGRIGTDARARPARRRAGSGSNQGRVIVRVDDA
jgi:hypothetical protein